ncbi:MAG: hypothetical protein Q3972_05645 [Corynebacterium sp.]|nr:hypothetical protein [Corynebacterium sp.]
MSTNPVCAQITANPSGFVNAVHRRLLTNRDLVFAGNNPEEDYATAVCYFIDNPEDSQTAWDMGLHQSIYGTESFVPWANALNEVLRELGKDLLFSDVFAAERAILSAARTMDEAMVHGVVDNAESFQWRARVVDVAKPCRRVSVVRLLAEQPIPYTAGQFLPYTRAHEFDGSPQGDWRFISAAIPPNDSGQLEFHLWHDLDDMDRPHVGDRWILGPGMGNLYCSGDRDILMIAADTGVAAAQAMILALSHFAHPPRVHLFYSATYPGELYDLRTLWHIAATSPWLSVTPVSTEKEDPWWVSATAASQPPRGLHLHQYGKVEDVVSSYGTWDDRDILIFGQNDRIEEIRATLIANGTPDELIQLDQIR